MKKKILLICFALILVSTFIVGVIFHKMMKDNYIESIVSNANSNIKLIHLVLEENPNADKYLFKLSQSFSQKTGFQITFIREDGIPLADSKDNSILFQSFESSPNFQNAKKNINSYFLKKNPHSKVQEIQIFTKVKFYNKKSMILVLSKELNFFEEFQEKTIFAILCGVVLSGILSILLSIYFTDWATKPITQLTKAVREISNGNFHPIIPLHSHDELEELSENFQNMNETIQKLLQDIQEKAENLQNILDHLSEGILVLNTSGTLVLVNTFAKSEFHIQQFPDNFFSQPEFSFCQKEVEEAFQQSKLFEIKKKVGNNSYRIHNHFMQEKRQMILVFQNITQLEKNEELRREFVSNASHELKTPLTIISGFIETIKLGHIQKQEQFDHILDIMEQETKRLNHLVNHLLQLSHLENASEEQVPKKSYSLALQEIIPKITDLYSSFLQEKKIHLEKHISPDFLFSSLSEEWIRVVLGNLLENAIKYSDSDSRIILHANIKDAHFYLQIQDFGCGIPKEEQEKIFQRFYRVDPSRNSKIKGNGLGLSIVKNMVEQAGGTISLLSTLQQGSTFTVSIPIPSKLQEC